MPGQGKTTLARKVYDDSVVRYHFDVGAWISISQGSRIIVTSRQTGVGLHPHRLRSLNEAESWDLFKQKEFRRGSCPPELIDIGKQITGKCGGLPLAIVVLAGLFAEKMDELVWWKEVAKRVSYYILKDPEQYMDTLALSYEYLPDHLKPCFLYFGAFPEDYEIPVQPLILLWVTEGFIRQSGQQSLEDSAEDYLIDLIDRNLVLASK
ncbi:hypothetical protein F0562_034365 [Nyssa sinensis]|uniref:Uncharacterized protein n=1 Tax=Nyssa sinensis TaxID=561372 RepID=A0A5J5AKX9_9ASTE|nr:hypothetical protein F0562_034365 [Nyssa sinensis]